MTPSLGFELYAMAALEHPSPSYTPVLCGVLDQRRDDMDRDCALIDAPESPEVLIDADVGFDAEVLAEHPRHERVLTFAGRDAGMARSEDTLELRVALADGPSWIGRFEGGYPSPAALTTVRSGPGFGQLLVVNRGAGFLVPAADPAAAVELDVGPIVALLLDAGSARVLVADFTRVARTPRPGGDGAPTSDGTGSSCTLHDVTDGLIRGRVWDAPRDQLVALEVDLATGRVLRGATPCP